MTSARSANRASSLNPLFQSRGRHKVVSYENPLRQNLLREALAREQVLLRQMDALTEQREVSSKLFAWREDAAKRVASLTPREHEIMQRVVAGEYTKNIAADLGISQRTVEGHRAAIMKKTGSKSIPALARLALAAAWNGAPQLDPRVE